MSNHTPGPWMQHVSAEPDYCYVKAGTEVLARVCHLSFERIGEQCANMTVMAAAPELLNAAQSLIQFMTENDERMTADGSRWADNPYSHDLRTAIAKAEGRSDA